MSKMGVRTLETSTPVQHRPDGTAEEAPVGSHCHLLHLLHGGEEETAFVLSVLESPRGRSVLGAVIEEVLSRTTISVIPRDAGEVMEGGEAH